MRRDQPRLILAPALRFEETMTKSTHIRVLVPGLGFVWMLLQLVTRTPPPLQPQHCAGSKVEDLFCPDSGGPRLSWWAMWYGDTHPPPWSQGSLAQNMRGSCIGDPSLGHSLDGDLPGGDDPLPSLPPPPPPPPPRSLRTTCSTTRCDPRRTNEDPDPSALGPPARRVGCAPSLRYGGSLPVGPPSSHTGIAPLLTLFPSDSTERNPITPGGCAHPSANRVPPRTPHNVAEMPLTESRVAER